jgi:ribose-phosphate pyrophosphokinase
MGGNAMDKLTPSPDMPAHNGRSMDTLRLFCGRANPELAIEIAQILGVDLGEISIKSLNDSETHVQIEESVRGAEIYLVQPTCQPVNETLMELLIIVDAMRRASADQITAVVPYYGYGRQDHKSTGREPLSARLVADLLANAGADRIVSVDLHAPQIQGFFNKVSDHLTAVTTLANHLRQRDLSNAVIVAPDVGRAKLAEKYTDLLGLPTEQTECVHGTTVMR